MTRTQAPYRETERVTIDQGPGSIETMTGSDVQPLLSVKKLDVAFKNIHALSSVDLQLFPGEVLGLLGDNGAGKSTLVETIMGLKKNFTGEIFFCGKRIERPSVKQLRDAGIEIAYQQAALNASMRVWQNFFIGKELTIKIGPFEFLDKRRMRRETKRFLEKVGIDMPFSVSTPVGKLSGGQRRILSILRAYYFAEKLLILDEPTAALGEHEVEIILNLVKKAQSDGISVIFITHKEHEVFDIADRFFILYQGNKYMVINRKYTLLNRVNSLLISSRVMAVQDIAAEIVFQFSQPLKDMRAKAEKLQYDYEVVDDPELFQELINTIMSEVRSLTSIIYHLSHLSEEPKLSRTDIQIRHLMQSVIREIPPQYREGIDFEILVEDELVCNVDGDIISQVLMNLVTNAIEASEGKGTITLSADCAGDESRDVIINVKDRGKGMDERTVQEIFNPFFTTKASNSGLGLSIVYKLLEIEDGSIDVSSSPEKGTEFSIHLKR